jgi:Spy/CpxP family protein refolding chaperone
MKKRTAIIAAAILAAIALVAAPIVFAGPHGMRGFGGMHGGMHGHGMGGGIFAHLRQLREELDLTDAQVDQIKTIFKEAHEQNAAAHQSLHGGFVAIAQALLANPNDLAGAQALLDKQDAAEKQLKLNVLTATSKALNVLTAEQRAKLSAKLAERAERHGQGRRSE